MPGLPRNQSKPRHHGSDKSEAPIASSVPRFLCDMMLARLARWLRAAGYDTLLANGDQSDRSLLAQAQKEHRILITRDGKFMERKGAREHVLLIDRDGVADQAQQLKRHLGLDWLHAPFSRCVIDNALLRRATAVEAGAVPSRVRARGGSVFACPDCGRLYWAGDHHSRMHQRLKDWNQPPSG